MVGPISRVAVGVVAASAPPVSVGADGVPVVVPADSVYELPTVPTVL